MNRIRVPALALCLLASLIACVHQFSHSHLLPIVIAVAVLVPIRWLRPTWFKWTLLLPAIAFALLLVDAFCLHHRWAVEMRAWSPIFDADSIEERLESPSGRTTVYLIGNHWLDSAYRVYVSHGHLFPSVSWLDTEQKVSAHPRERIVRWRGPFFVAGESEDSLSVAYDERDDRFYTYWDWTEGGL